MLDQACSGASHFGSFVGSCPNSMAATHIGNTPPSWAAGDKKSIEGAEAQLRVPLKAEGLI
jgi:hypothetical protein